jgi:hypothetical protein
MESGNPKPFETGHPPISSPRTCFSNFLALCRTCFSLFFQDVYQLHCAACWGAGFSYYTLDLPATGRYRISLRTGVYMEIRARSSARRKAKTIRYYGGGRIHRRDGNQRLPGI